MENTGKITPGSRVDIGRLGLGVVVRDGAPVPDIATPEAVKQALIKAKSIAYTDPKLGGTSVLHLMKFAETFGIKDEVVRKGVPATGGNDAVDQGRRGQSRHRRGADQRSPRQGRQAVGSLPEAIQLWTVYSAAIPINSAEPAAARAFVAALTAPQMREHWIKAGWQPVK